MFDLIYKTYNFCYNCIRNWIVKGLLNMKYSNREELKNKFVKLYLQGKTMQEIAKLTGCSRNFVSNLIKDNELVKDKKNKKTIKVYKLKTQRRMSIAINTDFLSKIGISINSNKDEYVDIEVNEKDKTITIKKHN